MIVGDLGIKTVKGGDNLAKARSFDIGDTSKIMGLLISGMYSDAPRAICQEIPSNARDAHREIGTPDRPIVIGLPDQHAKQPEFIVQDFGVGICPNRMYKVFIRLGNSTKDESNEETGGFGLGAKSPFAYSNIFTIDTISHDAEFTDGEGIKHSNVNVRRVYAAVMDETSKGKLQPMFEEITKEHTGTTIKIPVKKNDTYRFYENVKERLKFWKVKPIPLNGSPRIEWDEETKTIEGDNWYRSSETYGNCIIAVDGIPYRLNINSLIQGTKKDATSIATESKVRALNEFPIRVFFNTGEVKVTANREDIQYQDKATCELIFSKMVSILNEIKVQLASSIVSCTNLWDANHKFIVSKQHWRNLVEEADWTTIVKEGNVDVSKTFKVSGRNVYIPNSGMKVFNFNRMGVDVTSKRIKDISFNTPSDGIGILINDTGCVNPPRARVKGFFKSNPLIDRAIVISIADASSSDVAKDAWDFMENKCHFRLWPLKSLNAYEKIVAKRESGGSRAPTANVKRWQVTSYYKDKCLIEDVCCDDVDWENDEGVYVVLKNKSIYLTKDTTGASITTAQAALICSKLGIRELHGIHFKALDEVGEDFVSLNDKLLQEIEKLEKVPVGANECNVSNCDDLMQSAYYHTFCGMRDSGLDSLIAKNDSIFKKYYEVSVVNEKVVSQIAHYNELVELSKMDVKDKVSKINAFRNRYPSIDISKFKEQFRQKYYLVTKVYSVSKDDAAELAFYINAKDAV